MITRRTQPDAAHAMRLGLHALFAALLIVAVVQAISDDALDAWVSLALAVFVIAYLPSGILAGHRARPSTIAWLGLLCASWAVLVHLAAAFAWLAFPLYFLALLLLPHIPGLVTVAVIATVAAWRLWPTASSPAAALLGPTIGALVAIGLMWGIARIQAESAEKSRLLAQLQQTQHDLVALQDELAATQRRTGALTERARLARDIHDSLAQGYSSILLLARAGLARGSSDAELWTHVERTATDNLTEARRVVHALAPSSLDDAPLPAAITRLVERLAAESGIAADVEITGDPRLSSIAVDVAILRLVQGALANVRQHSRAQRARVSLSYEADEILVDIVDDGVGFDPSQIAATADGFGLRAMRERIQEFDGHLSIESSPGNGTAIAASFPQKAEP